MRKDAEPKSVRETNPFAEHGAQVERIWTKCEVAIEEATRESLHHREQGAVLLRWSITTCLTLNVGALVAAMNATEFDARSRFWSGIWFLGGALISLVVSAILASSFLKIANRMGAVAKDLKIALKLRDLEKIDGLDALKIREGETLGGFAFFLSIFAVIAFLVGASIMIEGAP